VDSGRVRLAEARASSLAAPPVLVTGAGGIATRVAGAWTLETAAGDPASGGDLLAADWVLGAPAVEPRAPSEPQLAAAARALGARAGPLAQIAPLHVAQRPARQPLLPWLAWFAALLMVPLFWLERAESRRADG
jgi:hypothetical protein